MIIKTLTIGPFQVNNYLVIDEGTQTSVLIDAGGDYETTINEAKKYNTKIEAILNTHGHFDHIAGDEELQSKENLKIYMHKDDEFLASQLKDYLERMNFKMAQPPKVDEYLEDNQELTFGNMKFKVIHTPGHTKGGVCFLIDNVLFSGDTLFDHCIGRTDLPGGSYEELKQSITKKLFVLDPDVVVYPGHGGSTTIGEEKDNNPYFGEKSQIC